MVKFVVINRGNGRIALKTAEADIFPSPATNRYIVAALDAGGSITANLPGPQHDGKDGSCFSIEDQFNSLMVETDVRIKDLARQYQYGKQFLSRQCRSVAVMA
ncbi:MAG: hypothetical protein JW715_07245 [Sedimentisphaerales bacterium]|nr:hypothetical protein [Sedimentisphaerales bacterium]